MSKSRRNLKAQEIEDRIKKNAFTNFEIKEKYSPSEMHQSYLETCMHYQTRMTILDGPAGSAKSYYAILSALKCLQKGMIDKIIYVRTLAESSGSKMGSLPGTVSEKFSPWAGPLEEKLHELLHAHDVNNLVNHEIVRCIPVNYLRGLSFDNACVIIEEAQNFTKKELTTALTRFGDQTKYFVIGDINQADIGGKSGFSEVFEVFNDEESAENCIYTFQFGEEEIVRSEILRFITKKLGC